MNDLPLIIFALIAAIWLIAAARQSLLLRALETLPELADIKNETIPAPGVAVVIAARDEAGHIEAAVRSHLAQVGVDLRVLVADDRSTDDTPTIVARLAAADARVEHVRIDELPAGWLGKCHALHTAAGRAGADWIVFADADTELSRPDTLARAAAFARESNADHLCLFPRMPARTRWARALATAFFLAALDRIAGLNSDRPGAYFGVGAFNMVRATKYHAVGGHSTLRLEVLDDVHIGGLIRRAGGVSRARAAFDAVTTTWGGTVPELISVLEKNMFAATGYRLWLVALATLAFAALWIPAALGPIVALALGSWTPILPTVATVIASAPAATLAHRLGFSRFEGALAPAVLPAIIYAGLRSTFLTLRRGGVRWRETFYPLADLRNDRRARTGRDTGG